jgi:hypothetical protein
MNERMRQPITKIESSEVTENPNYTQKLQLVLCLFWRTGA